MKRGHLVATTLGVLTALTILTSCMKKPDMTDPEVAPTSLQEVQSALSNAWGQADPSSMAPQDFVYSETEQKIEADDASVVLQEGITVSSRVEEAKDFLYTFVYQTVDILNGVSEASTRQDTRTVTKDRNTPLVAVHDLQRMQDLAQRSASKTAQPAVEHQMLLGFEKVLSLAFACHASDDLIKYCKDTLKVNNCDVQCNNLQVSNEVRPAPEQIKSQANCAGLPNCQMNVSKITFDWILILYADTGIERQKVKYEVATSTDLPFLSRVIDYCTQGLVTVPQTGSKILISVCDRMRNFKHGGT